MIKCNNINEKQAKIEIVKNDNSNNFNINPLFNNFLVFLNSVVKFNQKPNLNNQNDKSYQYVQENIFKNTKKTKYGIILYEKYFQKMIQLWVNKFETTVITNMIKNGKIDSREIGRAHV